MTPYFGKASNRAAFALIAAALSSTATACLCSNWETSKLEATASQYEEVFSGLIIWQSSEPREALPDTLGMPALNPGSWVKSKVLVLRVWRGELPMVAEVWTPVVTSCDYWPIPGSYFVSLVEHDAGRRVAENSECAEPLRDYATSGPAKIAMSGYATIAAVLGLFTMLAVWVTKLVRRRRVRTGRS